MISSPQTIGFNGFLMVLGPFNYWFQWFSMVMDHWSNDAMVSMYRSPLNPCRRTDRQTDGRRNSCGRDPSKVVQKVLADLKRGKDMFRIWRVLCFLVGEAYGPELTRITGCQNVSNDLLATTMLNSYKMCKDWYVGWIWKRFWQIERKPFRSYLAHMKFNFHTIEFVRRGNREYGLQGK